MIINVWLGVRDDAQALIVERLKWDDESQGEYAGAVPDRVLRFFQLMADWQIVQDIFRTDTDASRAWYLWNVSFDKPKDAMIKVKAELDWLLDTYTNQTRIGAAWHWDGRQVGTQFTYDENGVITGTTGTPVYPLHARLIEFMPDIVTYDDDGNETSRTRPTVLSDVNLGLGQTPRQF